jgi:hypothetical protein
MVSKNTGDGQYQQDVIQASERLARRTHTPTHLPHIEDKVRMIA